MTQRLTLPELEDYIRGIDAASYAKTRNYLGGSTRLSEYISRGFIGLPRVQELILEKNTKSNSFKVLSELSWREYWHHTWRVRGDEIFDYFRPLKETPRQGMPTAILNAETGIEALDKGIRQLYETGFIDNHMRMWLAGLVCNIAKCDWKIGAEWMHSYLIDGDYASNHLSWQWVAGSYTGSSYLPQQGNINRYTKTNQTNSFLDKPYSDLAEIDIPSQLQDLTTAVPGHKSTPITTTTDLEAISNAETVLLYSPWTLDPTWRADQTGMKVLVLPAEIYVDGAFSQNVLDSIAHFSSLIPDLKTIYLSKHELTSLKTHKIYRKDYPGIVDWPGNVDGAELLHPDLPQTFYPSYSAYWKAIKNHDKTADQITLDL